MKKLALLIGLLSSFKSYAGGGTVGNGGDVIVCKDKVVMLDTYEALNLRNYKLGLNAPADSVEMKIKVAIKRIAGFDPYRAAIIARLATAFMEESKFVRDVKLRDVEDSNEVFLPEGCEIQQIAIQNTRVIYTDPFYIVNADLWDQLDNDNKAILILHESIFRAAKGAWPSPTVRFLNSVGFSTFMDTMAQKDYYELVYGTVLNDTLNAGVGKNGRWYFQIPEIPPNFDHFMTPAKWDRNGAAKSWEYMCTMKYSGWPVSASDIPEISDIIRNKFDWGTFDSPWPTRTILAKEGKQLKAFDITPLGDQKVNLDKNVKAEPWCVSDRFLFDAWWK